MSQTYCIDDLTAVCVHAEVMPAFKGSTKFACYCVLSGTDALVQMHSCNVSRQHNCPCHGIDDDTGIDQDNTQLLYTDLLLVIRFTPMGVRNIKTSVGVRGPARKNNGGGAQLLCDLLSGPSLDTAVRLLDDAAR